MTALLEAKGIKKYYGQEAVLAGVDLVVKQGELISIVGQSGTGKTTLLSIIGLLQNPTEGRMRIGEENATLLNSAARAKLRSRYIGFVFQRARLVGALTALENVMLPAWLFGHDKALANRAEALLTELDLKHRFHYLPEQLSIGQMRRVALARALLLQPKIILADEPTNDLDEETAQVVFDNLQKARNNGSAVILVTHDKKYSGLADRIFVLREGMLYERGSGEEEAKNEYN
jgi:ABC-type lipoprotein export system ATPase subunit